MKKITLLLFSIFMVLNSAFAADYENLYIVGNACSAGWDPGKALEMTKETDGSFTWTGRLHKPLNDNSQERFKFLVTNDWNPSITCRIDVAGHLMTESGVEYDIYEKAENEGNDNAFQVAEDAVYTIVINLSTMKMTCTKTGDVNPETPDLEQLYLVGAATEAGWDPFKAIPMEKVATGIFVWTGELKITTETDGDLFKFLNQSGTWNKTFNPTEENLAFVPGSQYDLVFRPDESAPNDYKFKVTTAGEYSILVDLNEMKISIDNAAPDMSELYLIGSATSAGWETDNAIAMQKVEDGLFTWSGNLSVNEGVENGNEFKFLTKRGWSNTYSPAGGDVEFAVSTSYDLNYRPFESSPYDFKFKVTTTGTYTIDVDLNNMSVIIEAGGSGLDDVNNSSFWVNAENGSINLYTENGITLQTVDIFDITGKLMTSASNVIGSVVLAEGLSAGVYLVKANYNNQEIVQKVIVK